MLAHEPARVPSRSATTELPLDLPTPFSTGSLQIALGTTKTGALGRTFFCFTPKEATGALVSDPSTTGLAERPRPR